MSNIDEIKRAISDAVAKKRRLEQNLAEIRYKIVVAERHIAKKSRSSSTTQTTAAGGDLAAIRTHVARVPRDDERPGRQQPSELARLKEREAEISVQLADVNNRLNGLLIDMGTIGPAEATRSMSSSLPILLFPIRIETKFQIDANGQNSQLLVRAYPDNIAIQTHENNLTEGEIEAGKNYWRRVWFAGKSDIETRKSAWGVLCAQYGAYRASWIVRSLEKVLKNKHQWPADKIIPDAGTPPEPDFDNIEPKPSSWTLPPATYVMPDRWVVITYSGDKETRRVVGNPIKPKLNVGFDPLSDSEADIGGEGQLKVDDAMKWMIDFNTAEREGMGIRVNINAEEARNGFTRVIVAGLKYSADENESVALLEQLFESHHYTSGMSFVPQGTPTNNTEIRRAGFSSKDNNYQDSFRVEVLDSPLYVPSNDLYKSKDGELAANAFGLNPTFFGHTENSELSEQQEARHMNTALWPATLGYYLEEMMHPVFKMEDIRKGRRFFISNVRGRGPFPAFRIGKTPYGILPTSSLTRWKSLPEDGKIESVLPDFLRKLLPIWSQNIAQGPNTRGVPRVGGSNDPDSDLLNILGMDASSYEFHARDGIGTDYLNNLANFLWYASEGGNAFDDLLQLFLSQDQADWMLHHYIPIKNLLRSLGYPEWNPRIIDISLQNDNNLNLDTVKQGALSELEPLKGNENYIEWLGNPATSIEQIRQRKQFSTNSPNSLLFMILRHSMLREYVSTSFRILTARELVTEKEAREPELIGMRVNEKPRTVYSGLDMEVERMTSGSTLGHYLQKVTRDDVAVDPDLQELAELRESFDHLKNVPTAKLERLMSETLDLCSHRLDAWITSLYTDRLHKKRKEKPAGIYIGGYGWLEDLRPKKSKVPVDQISLPAHIKDAISLNKRGAEKKLPIPLVSPDSAGFIHAPSLSHAAAAAVLANAYLSRTLDKEQFRVNLSSERVRRSLWFLDGIRQGQSLAALLGYRFERGLHENHRGYELDKYIQPLRDLFPLDPSTPIQDQQSLDSAETIQARNVVNGLKMLRKWQEEKENFLPNLIASDALHISDQGEKDAIIQEIRALDDIVDGISDLVLAESAFQVIQGNTTRLAANLSAYSSGERPPEPEIVKTPRGGVRLTHRVMLVFFGGKILPNSWNYASDNPRAKAEPNLNAWVANALGDPAKIVCKAKYKNSGSAVSIEEEVTVKDLGICPLDFLELSISLAKQQKSELDARVAYFMLADHPQRTDLKIKYAVPPAELGSDKISFADALLFARKLRQLITEAREFTPEHIQLPEETSSTAVEQVDVEDLFGDQAGTKTGRVIDLMDGLESAIDALDNAANTPTLDESNLKNALMTASFFIPEAVPIPLQAAKSDRYLELLKELALSKKTELAKRLDEAEKLIIELEKLEQKQPSKSDLINAQVKTAISITKTVFGESFKLLPQFRTGNSTELNNSLSSAKLLKGNGDAPVLWFQQAAKVRPALSRYEDVMAFAEALGRHSLGFKVAQIPYDKDENWVALPFAEEDRPVNGKLSLVFAPHGNPDFTENLSGLTIDDWVEVIPNKKETTGVAFHYDVPSSEAPQTLLVAVSPGTSPTWEFDDILAMLNETLDLAKVRAVDRDLLTGLAHFLPALLFTGNLKGDAIDTDFAQANMIKIAYDENMGRIGIAREGAIRWDQ